MMNANSVALPEATAARQVRQNAEPWGILGGSGDTADSIVPARSCLLSFWVTLLTDIPV